MGSRVIVFYDYAYYGLQFNSPRFPLYI